MISALPSSGGAQHRLAVEHGTSTLHIKVQSSAAADNIMRTILQRLDDVPMPIEKLVGETRFVLDLILPRTALRQQPRLVISATCEEPTSAHAHGDRGVPRITIDRALLAFMYQLSEADAYLHMRQNNQALRETGAASFINHLLQHWLKNKGAGKVCPAPDFAEFFRLPRGVGAALRRDQEFNKLAALGWYGAMLFVLAHEIAHIELDHSHDAGKDFADMEIEADDRATQVLEAIEPGNEIAGGWVRSYVTAMFYLQAAENKRTGSSAPPSPEHVIKLCLRTLEIQEQTLLGPHSPFRQPRSPITIEDAKQRIRDGRAQCQQLFR